MSDERRASLHEQLGRAPAIELASQGQALWEAAWQTESNTEYDRLVLRFALAWARLMQLHLVEGKALEAVWSTALHDASFLRGMSGAGEDAGAALLFACWIHGEELRTLYENYQ